MKLEISCDDGALEDLRVADLLEKYQLPCTFYIPSSSPLMPSDIKDLAEKFEIGGHTVSHPQDLKLLSDDSLDAELAENKIWLEKIIGREVTSFCYPRGRYDERVIEAVIRAGFKQARTTMVGSTDYPLDAFRHHTTVHAFNRSEYEGEEWLSYATRKFHEASQKPDGYFHLWFHSWEIHKNNDWGRLEEIFKIINENLPEYSTGK